MASSQDTEITLGTAKLLGLFFGLVVICAVFFDWATRWGASPSWPVCGNYAGSVAGLERREAGSSGAAASTPMTFL